MTELSVNIEQTIHAPIDRVFDAWLDPTLLARFILPMRGMPAPEVANEAREGGRFSIIMQVGEERIPHTGTYLVIDRPHRLSFTWESPYSVDDSIVTLDMSEIDAETTRIELRHVRFVHEEARSDHEGGWTTILEILDEIL